MTVHTRVRRTARRIAPVAVALVTALPLAACSQDDGATDTDDAVETTDQDQTEPEAGLDPARLTFDELQDDVRNRIGDEVEVLGEVARVVTPEVFTIRSTDGVTVEPLVVIDADPDDDLEVGTPVLVTAQVERNFVASQVEALVDVQLDDEVAGEWEDRPYLEAYQVETEPTDAG